MEVQSSHHVYEERASSRPNESDIGTELGDSELPNVLERASITWKGIATTLTQPRNSPNQDDLPGHSSSSCAQLKAQSDFSENNHFMSTSDPLKTGLDTIASERSLHTACLTLEAACQLSPNGHNEWKALGLALYAGCVPMKARTALERAMLLKDDDIMVTLTLATLYFNDGYDYLAHRVLEKWLLRKASESGIIFPRPENGSFTDLLHTAQTLEGWFQIAIQADLNSDRLDLDLYWAFGLLLFSTENFEQAAECFSHVVGLNQTGNGTEAYATHMLWNQYGSALAKMERYQEAMTAWDTCLRLEPNFMVTYYNLMITNYNSANYSTASELALKLLTYKQKPMLQMVVVDSSHGQLEEIMVYPESENIYMVLKESLAMQNRNALVEIRAFE